jgi:hypothetical protein
MSSNIQQIKSGSAKPTGIACLVGIVAGVGVALGGVASAQGTAEGVNPNSLYTYADN